MSATKASVFIVSGSAGSYEDQTNWIAGVFTEKKAAEDWRRACADYVEKFSERRARYMAKDDSAPDFYEKIPKAKSPFDPRLDKDDTDAQYHVGEYELNPAARSATKKARR